MLRFLTAGESHGYALTVIIDGVPAGVELTREYINRQLARRQKGYGRGARMQIEYDQVVILSGVRDGKTLGSPVSLQILNRDWQNWREVMAAEAGKNSAAGKISAPRPGHADLAGALKYRHQDLRNVLERASARETAARVAAGAVAGALLVNFGIEIHSHVTAIGPAAVRGRTPPDWERVEESPVRCSDPAAVREMVQAIDAAKEQGETLGGIFEIVVLNLPVGLGDYTQWDRRLDGLLAQALASIPGVKGVEFGDGFALASIPGSQAADAIFHTPERGLHRLTNHSGGLEGGMTNGEVLVVRAAMKPIPTLRNPLPSVDLRSMKASLAAVERSDVCAVPAAAVVAEAMTAVVCADALLSKFGGDSLADLIESWQNYRERLTEEGCKI